MEDQIRIVSQERDNVRKRVTEVENRLWEKEDVVDKLRKDYNDLLEKHMSSPNKVTTTSTTVKTVVDKDGNVRTFTDQEPPQAVDADSQPWMVENGYSQSANRPMNESEREEARKEMIEA